MHNIKAFEFIDQVLHNWFIQVQFSGKPTYIIKVDVAAGGLIEGGTKCCSFSNFPFKEICSVSAAYLQFCPTIVRGQFEIRTL